MTKTEWLQACSDSGLSQSELSSQWDTLDSIFASFIRRRKEILGSGGLYEALLAGRLGLNGLVGDVLD